jgi:hypothetical protein
MTTRQSQEVFPIPTYNCGLPYLNLVTFLQLSLAYSYHDHKTIVRSFPIPTYNCGLPYLNFVTFLQLSLAYSYSYHTNV